MTTWTDSVYNPVSSISFGYPTAVIFSSPTITLSSSTTTVVDWTNATGNVLSCQGSTNGGMPFSCGWSVTDPTTGSYVEYGQYVSQNYQNPGAPSTWEFRLAFPPNASAPSVVVKAYLMYLPTNPSTFL